MKASAILILCAVNAANGFAPPTQSTAQVLASMRLEDTPAGGRIRKRDQIKNVVKNAFGLKKEESTFGEVSTQANGVQVQHTGPKRRMMKLDGKKYEKIECLEEKAFQILKDLNMIEEHN